MKEKLLRVIKKILFLPPVPTIIIFIVSMTFVALALSLDDMPDALKYIAYGFSAYGLTVFIFGIKPAFQSAKKAVYGSKIYKFLQSNKITQMFLNDMMFKGTVSLYQGLAMSTLYAVFKTITAIYYNSAWLYSVSAYYFFFGVIRLILVHGSRKLKNTDENGKLFLEYRQYRVCGILTFLINIAMTGMTFLMIHDNEHSEYPGFIIYLSAIYTFYAFIIAVRNLVKFHKIKSPILSASKALNFEAAMMSLFSLQTSMIAEFGGDDSFRQIANTITGAAVCTATFGIAVFMIINSCVKLKKLRVNKSEVN